MQQTESLFHTYSQYASKSDIEPSPSEEEQRLEEQLNDILDKVRDTLHNPHYLPSLLSLH